MSAAGHVFIARGDIRAIACDAWLMPCAFDAEPMDKWIPEGAPQPVPAQPLGPNERVTPVVGWPADRSPPWLTDVGGGPSTPISWFVEGLRAFLDTAAPEVSAGPARGGRVRPLLAVPLVGTSKGGARLRAGELLSALLRELYRAVDTHCVDIVLVCWEAPMFAAALAERRRWVRGRGWGLPKATLAATAKLAGAASRGELVLFLGAGVSAGAGVPLWHALLSTLATSAGLDADERVELARLDPRDQAAVIERRLGSRRALTQAISAEMAGREVSVTHALLAGLPVREVVTTNYDPLFERASQAAGQRIAVLPWDPPDGADRWLLKLHGCVDRPDDIVLTRHDYLRWADRRAALAGIVQALLITRHMLFVGFSLSDDNFHRIVDAVRLALGEGRGGRMGTALMLAPTPLLEDLWERDLKWVTAAGAEASVAEAARSLEIVLDRISDKARTGAGSHLLDPRYDPVLSDGEREVRGVVAHLDEQLRTLSPEARSTAAWERLRAMIRELGG